VRFFKFAGGCVTFTYKFAPGSETSLLVDAELGMSLVPRSLGVRRLLKEADVILCGAGAPPCAGEKS
jgi:hypothetical protein